MTIHEASLTTLSSEECYQLLGSRRYGRVGYIAEHYPLIIPVNFAVDQGIIVIRSGPGQKLTSIEHANITFQVDDIDEETHSGWSVLVRGQAEEVTAGHSAEIIKRTHETELQPWAPGAESHWVRVIPHGISGRRITPGVDVDWELGTAAYM